MKGVLAEFGSPQIAVDSITRLYGPYSENLLKRRKDIETIDSAYLCDNIEWAFKVWQEQPWGKNVTFGTFKQQILPYRIADEILVIWREPYYRQLQGIIREFLKQDSVDTEDPVEAARFLLKHILPRDHERFSSEVPAPLPHIGPM